MIRFEELYPIKKRFPTKYDWPSWEYFRVARQLGNLAERLEKEMARKDVYDPYTHNWIIACLDACIAGAYDFIMHLDPENAGNVAYWRCEHKITLPTKQSVPLHFPYIPFNVRNAIGNNSLDYYKTEIVKRQRIKAEYRKLTKFLPNREISYSVTRSWENIAKFWHNEFEYKGRMSKHYTYKHPFKEKGSDKYRLNKMYAAYIVAITMQAKELKERYMSGEFLNTEWKMKLTGVK